MPSSFDGFSPLRSTDQATQTVSDQTATIEFLSRPESYVEAPNLIERIDTHAAIIFLAGDKAYKLKRAVTLPYLDFSTPEKRRQVCEHEFALNRPTAPSLYVRVLPIVRKHPGDALTLGGEGVPVDWVIEMKRFDQEALFDRFAAAGQLQIRDIENLAVAIAAFHKDAPANPTAQWLQSLDNIVDTLGVAFRSEPARNAGIKMGDYVSRLRREIDLRERLLAQRQSDGFVRRCHGDLHLRNIVMMDGRPVLFDALEFDERLSTTDVLYDLAFPIMDLWRRDLKHHANALLNAYILDHGNLAGLQCLPMFLSLRAAVRTMVGLHSLVHVSGKKADELVSDIQRYAILASQLLSPSRPQLIAIGGVSGTGKSSLAKRLAPFIGAAPGAIHFRTDVERKRMAGVALSEKLGSKHYSASQRGCVYRRVSDRAGVTLAAGHSAIIDGTFLDEADRALVAGGAVRQNINFQGLWLEAPPDVLIARVAARHGDASDADVTVVNRQLATALTPADWLKIDASGDEQQALQRALLALGVAA